MVGHESQGKIDKKEIIQILVGVEGTNWCFNCKKHYVVTYPTLEACPLTDLPAREQHISGLCSQECWDKVFEGLEDEE